MCRLAYVTKRFGGLPEWLAAMEKSFGGDGNGVAIAGRRNRLEKGVDVQVPLTVAMILGGKGPALWHSRKCSSGSKTDCLCHPFACAGGWLAHNGHWHAGEQAASMFRALCESDEMSDTLLFSRLADKLGFEGAIDKFAPSGVWLWMDRDGRLSVWKSGGSLWFSRKLGAWGSEPAATGHWFEVEDGWHGPGQRPKEAKPKGLWEPWQVNSATGRLLAPASRMRGW